MEGFRHRATVGAAKVAIVASVLATLAPSPARADLRDATSDATSSRAGVDFSIRQVTGTAASVTSSGPGVTCDYHHTKDFWTTGSQTHVLAHRTCTDGIDDYVWVDACDYFDLDRCSVPTPGPAPVDLAREVKDHLPIPATRIMSNPRRGLVGVETWFWMHGGDRVFADSLSAFGVRVDVEARATSYRWDFGDGTQKTTTSAGQPYPLRPAVTHRYERSSAELAEGYRVTVTTVYRAQWRTGDGRWRSLPGISRMSTRFYPVAQSQAVNSRG